MSLPVQTQDQLVALQVASVQSGASGLQDYSDGAVLLALAQSNGEVGLWLQALLLIVALLTRASTSTGSDLDSWMADFNFDRLPAIASTGQALFARVSTGAQVVVSTGSTVETQDGTQTFVVLADTANGAYSSTLGGYPVAANATSVSATVQAVTPGAASNVASGTITVISGAIPGVDTVTNPQAFTCGANAEADAAFLARWWAHLASLAQGTPAAVRTAVAGVQQGLDIELVENQSISGQAQSGYFYVVADDGTGSPSSALLSEIRAAADGARGLGIEFAVIGPQLVEITIVMTITGGSTSAVQTALTAYVDGAGLGGMVEWSRLTAIAYEASSGVTNVTGVLLNGGTADIVCTDQQRPIVNSVTVNL